MASTAAASASSTNTTTTRCTILPAPPSRYRFCRLSTTADIMNGSTTIVSKST
ncbi:hypothetical protein D3C72_2292400 [compost metagenome]